MKALSWDKGRELSWESSLTRTWWFPLPTHPRWHDIEKGQGQGFVLYSGLQLKYNILLYSILLQETPPLKFAKKCDDAKRYQADDAMRTMIVVVVTVILGQQFRTKAKSLEWIQFTMNERNTFLGKAPASFITESFFSFSVIAVLSSSVWPNWDHYIQCQAQSVSSFILPLKHKSFFLPVRRGYSDWK